jgi:Domain of unknown function (DUF6316)
VSVQAGSGYLGGVGSRTRQTTEDTTMSKMRASDTTATEHFRTDRIVCEKGLWYFFTREKTLEGPFTSRKGAEQFLQTFIALSKLSSGFEADLMPMDGQDAQKAGHKAPRWVQDPFHRRFGTAA